MWIAGNQQSPFKLLADRHHAQVTNLLSSLVKVKDLLDPDGRNWNRDLLDLINSRRMIEVILRSLDLVELELRTTIRKLGHYTVKSGYWIHTNVLSKQGKAQEILQPSLNALYQMVWKTETSPKVKHFIWKCLSNSLPVAKRLESKRVIKDPQCSRCQGKEEDTNHLLFLCPYARLVWALSNVPAPPNGEMAHSIYSNLHRVFTISKTHPQEEEAEYLAPWIMWRLWRNPNEVITKGEDYNAIEVCNKLDNPPTGSG